MSILHIVTETYFALCGALAAYAIITSFKGH